MFCWKKVLDDLFSCFNYVVSGICWQDILAISPSTIYRTWDLKTNVMKSWRSSKGSGRRNWRKRNGGKMCWFRRRRWSSGNISIAEIFIYMSVGGSTIHISDWWNMPPCVGTCYPAWWPCAGQYRRCLCMTCAKFDLRTVVIDKGPDIRYHLLQCYSICRFCMF